MYNEIWTRDKHIEYRKLKRSGYTPEMLMKHFGEDIYHSGMYNKKSTILPYLDFITEISITPEKTTYSLTKTKSDIYQNKFDYVSSFTDNSVKYIISLFCYFINNIETYNIVLTTEKQWMDYKTRIGQLRGRITDAEREELVNIIEKETGYNKIYSVMKKTSYVLFDVINKNMGNITISLGETTNPVKINLYRNIILNSFKDSVDDIGEVFDQNNNKYYLYKIKKI